MYQYPRVPQACWSSQVLWLRYHVCSEDSLTKPSRCAPFVLISSRLFLSLVCIVLSSVSRLPTIYIYIYISKIKVICYGFVNNTLFLNSSEVFYRYLATMTTLYGNACVWKEGKQVVSHKKKKKKRKKKKKKRAQWEWIMTVSHFNHGSGLATNHWVFLGTIGRLFLFDFIVKPWLRKNQFFFLI